MTENMTKAELRREIRQKLKSLSLETIAEKSRKICTRFESEPTLHDIFDKSENIAFFMPMATEVDVTPLILHAMSSGKNCYLPRVDTDENASQTMIFFKLDNSVPLERQLEKGSYGIREPLTTLPRLPDLQQSDDVIFFGDLKDFVVIVPGLAFGRKYDNKEKYDSVGELGFSRIGKGKGYYDRFFEKYDNWLLTDTENMILHKNMTSKTMTKIAVCFECQLFDAVPHENYDKKVDIIVTENAMLL